MMKKHLRILVYQKGNFPTVSIDKVVGLLQDCNDQTEIRETNDTVISFKNLVQKTCCDIATERKGGKTDVRFLVVSVDAIMGAGNFNSMVASALAFEQRQKHSDFLYWATFGSAFDVQPKFPNVNFNFGKKVEPPADPNVILAQKIRESWKEIFPN